MIFKRRAETGVPSCCASLNTGARTPLKWPTDDGKPNILFSMWMSVTGGRNMKM